MKVVILYRPNSEHARRTEEFIHDFQSRYQNQRMEVMNIDTRDGSSLASLYDIMQKPAVMVLQDNGSPQRIWQGESLPMMDEVASYART